MKDAITGPETNLVPFSPLGWSHPMNSRRGKRQKAAISKINYFTTATPHP
jgi:hypothetical protein